jgi:hypothetical protein
VIHEYLPEPSQRIDEGVPVGCGASQPSPPCIPGPLQVPEAMTADAGRLFVVQRRGEPEGSWVDKFDASTGAFLPSQLEEEGGLSGLTQALGVDHAGGEERVFVGASREHNGEREGAVAVVGASGKLLPEGVWTGAGTANGSFTENAQGHREGEIQGVAVDSSGNPETSGDVYVATSSFGAANFNVVDVFTPGVGGKEPAKTTTQLTGASASEPFVGPTGGIAVSGFNGDLLVGDHVAEAETNVVDVFEPLAGMYSLRFKLTGTPQGSFQEIGSIAVDGATGDIYVVEKRLNVVDQFNAAGEYVGRLTGTTGGTGEPFPFRLVQSVAVDRESHRVFVGDYDSEARASSVDVFAGGRVVPDVSIEAASNERPFSATLHGQIDARALPLTDCHFDYGATTSYGQHAPCEPPSGSIPVDSSKHPVSANIAGLQPHTLYHYRLTGANANGSNTGECPEDCGEFKTSGPGVHAASVSDVAATSATFEATIDPDGAPTSYYFQYGTSTAYEAQAPAAPGAGVGSGEGDVEVTPQPVQGLLPGTVYHYRVVAVSTLPGGELEAFPGPDQTFTTQTSASGSVLLDGRSWEQVSPADKHGALLQPIGEEGLLQAAAGGQAMSYLADVPTEADPQGYSDLVQVLATRGSDGWSSRDLATPHETPVGVSLGAGHEYRFFSEDLSHGVVQPAGAFLPSSSPLALAPSEASEQTPFLHTNFPAENVTETCPTQSQAEAYVSCYRPLVTGKPGFANVPAGTVFGTGEENGRCETHACGPTFVGGSADLSHVVLESTVALTETPTAGQAELYEWSGAQPAPQQLQLISVLPHGGGPSGASARFGTGGFGIARHAISNDGSRIVWSEEGGGAHLYMRDTAKAETVQLDAPESGCQPCGVGSGGQSLVFQAASRDGSHVFFTDTQPLTKDSGATGAIADVYECEMVEVASELRCKLSDLTPAHGGERAGLIRTIGVVSVSDDGSYVYFVANDIRGDGSERGAVHGDCTNGFVAQSSCNLYMLHYDDVKNEWAPAHFITVLSGSDRSDFEPGGGLGTLTARVSPDGHWFTFMSQGSPTGYDNRDAVSGKPDQEVFLYHADDGTLVCASCDPTGARPLGVEYSKLNSKLAGGFVLFENDQWVAANVPGWTQYAPRHPLYQSRYLSDNGRLFFNSSDALTPRDVNKTEDVYEFEPPGTGGCVVGGTGFSVRSGGCVGLVSSGGSAEESAFLDASEGGGDVFFLTAAKLVAGDRDTALDVYDAHECTSMSPCPVPVPVPPPCDTGDACKAAPSPQPSIFGAPASATFAGVGNPVFAESRVKLVKCKRGDVRKGKGRGRCVAKRKRQRARTHAKRGRK